MDPRAAWTACGQPKGPAGLQNVRKRGFKERARIVALAEAVTAEAETAEAEGEAEDEPAEATATAARAVGQHGPAKKGFRLRKDHVKAQQRSALQRRADFDALLAEATNEWQQMVCAGTNGRGANSADGVAARYMQRSCPMVTKLQDAC